MKGISQTIACGLMTLTEGALFGEVGAGQRNCCKSTSYATPNIASSQYYNLGDIIIDIRGYLRFLYIHVLNRQHDLLPSRPRICN